MTKRKLNKKKLTFCPVCLKETEYLFCSVECKEKSQVKNISPSGLILIHDGKEYPVMLDRTNGYKFTCKEATDEEFPDSLCLLSFTNGPINLKLKVDPKKAEEVKKIMEQEIETYKEMIKDGKEFIKAIKKPYNFRVFPLGTARGGQIRP